MVIVLTTEIAAKKGIKCETEASFEVFEREEVDFEIFLLISSA